MHPQIIQKHKFEIPKKLQIKNRILHDLKRCSETYFY